MAILGSWSGMRKYLEEEMLCEKLQGRLHYDCTTYKGMDGHYLIRVYVDNKIYKKFSHEAVIDYFISSEIDKNCTMYGGYGALLEKYSVAERPEYTSSEFCEALNFYRNHDIQLSIHSDNPIVVMFALLDRRIGERTLKNLESEAERYPKWLRDVYKLRVESAYR